MSLTSEHHDRVKHLLTSLRDSPTRDVSDGVLADVYLYLMNLSTGDFHWYCNKSESTVIEAANFLIRLMAYRSEEVNRWKAKLQECLRRCASCVQGFERGKVTSKNTYVVLMI